MGVRTQSRIGTTEGVKTVRVFSANPKTPGGLNTIIFRRDVVRTLRKLSWAPIIDASENPQPEGVELSDEHIPYSRDQKKQLIDFLTSRLKAQYGVVANDDFGPVTLQRSFAKEIQRHAIATRREFLAALSARQIARQMVHFAAAPNEEIGRTNGIRYFEYGLSRVRIAQDIYLVMGIVGVREGTTPYYDQHVVAKFKVDSEASSIQGHMQFGESTLDGENNSKSSDELQAGLVTSKAGSEVTFLHEQPRIGESAFDAVYDNRFRLILQAVAAYNKV